MNSVFSFMITFLMGAFRSRLSLQLEIAALRNQLAELEWLESPKAQEAWLALSSTTLARAKSCTSEPVSSGGPSQLQYHC